MIENLRNLKKISIIDGKYYEARDIEAITETNEEIIITTKRDKVHIPKTAISRIEYYKRSCWCNDN